MLLPCGECARGRARLRLRLLAEHHLPLQALQAGRQAADDSATLTLTFQLTFLFSTWRDISWT